MVCVKTERPLCVDEAPVHITVTHQAGLRVRWIKYVKPDQPHEPECLLGVIDGHVVVWL